MVTVTAMVIERLCQILMMTSLAKAKSDDQKTRRKEDELKVKRDQIVLL